MRFGTDILRQADVLAAFTEDPPGVTRTYLTPQHRQAGDCIAALMREAGMDASYDALGNGRKKQVLWSVVSAKRPKTRAARIARIIDELS